MADIPSPATDDPFIGTPQQTSRTRATCTIIVDGVDVTNKVEPFLVSVHIIDAPKSEAHIELDDRDGRLPIPPLYKKVLILLGWQTLIEQSVFRFEGQIVDVEHGFGRKQGGRRMWIHAQGIDFSKSYIKSPQTMTKGEGAPPGKEEGEKVKQGDFLQEAAKNAKANLKIHPALANMMRDWWQQSNESFMSLIMNSANEHGGVYQFRNGNEAELTLPGFHASGDPTITIYAKWHDNLIGYRVRPMASRSIWGSSQQDHFDHAKSIWNRVQKQFNLPQPWGGGQSPYQLPAPAPNSSVGGQQNEGVGQSPRVGDGRIVINGEPAATWNCTVVIIGVRPGVDGPYHCFQAEHLYSRQGYVTWLDVWPRAVASPGGGEGGGGG